MSETCVWCKQATSDPGHLSECVVRAHWLDVEDSNFEETP